VGAVLHRVRASAGAAGGGRLAAAGGGRGGSGSGSAVAAGCCTAGGCGCASAGAALRSRSGPSSSSSLERTSSSSHCAYIRANSTPSRSNPPAAASGVQPASCVPHTPSSRSLSPAAAAAAARGVAPGGVVRIFKSTGPAEWQQGELPVVLQMSMRSIGLVSGFGCSRWQLVAVSYSPNDRPSLTFTQHPTQTPTPQNRNQSKTARSGSWPAPPTRPGWRG